MLLKSIIRDDDFKTGGIYLLKFRTKSWFLEFIDRRFCGSWDFYSWSIYIFEKISAFILCFCCILCMFIIFYIVNMLRNFFIASSIMLMLICLKDLSWAATGRVSAVSLSVLHHLGFWKGGSGFRCDVLSFWDDRSEQGSKRQNLWVRLEVGVLLEERDTSWWILEDCSCSISKNLLELFSKSVFKTLLKILKSYFLNS